MTISGQLTEAAEADRAWEERVPTKSQGAKGLDLVRWALWKTGTTDPDEDHPERIIRAEAEAITADDEWGQRGSTITLYGAKGHSKGDIQGDMIRPVTLADVARELKRAGMKKR